MHYASRLLESAGLGNRVMVDMSHANSNKDHKRQVAVCADICSQLADGESRLMGVMIESNLMEGRQDLGDPASLTYGQSITDACIDWDDTLQCLDSLAEANRKRMGG